jgi:hypothetical protein
MFLSNELFDNVWSYPYQIEKRSTSYINTCLGYYNLAASLSEDNLAFIILRTRRPFLSLRYHRPQSSFKYLPRVPAKF